MVCIDLYHSSLLSFIEISIKFTPLQQIVPITSINLITWGEFGKISPNDLKSAVNCLYTMYLNGDFNMTMVGWMEIIKISIISRSSLMTLTRLTLVGLLFDLFYQIIDKIYQSVTCNQL